MTQQRGAGEQRIENAAGLVPHIAATLAACGSRPPAYMMASPDKLNVDPLMQARAVAQGTTFDPRVVKQLHEHYDPDLMTALDVAPTPGKPGEYTVLGGMHRRQFGLEAGIDLPVRVHDLDLSDPAGFKTAQQIADASNATQRDVSLKGLINIIGRAGTDDVAALRAKYPRFNDQQILDAQHISQLPGHVVDKLEAMPASTPQIGIAAEVGRGAKVYGLTPMQGEGLFNQFAAGPRKEDHFEDLDHALAFGFGDRPRSGEYAAAIRRGWVDASTFINSPTMLESQERILSMQKEWRDAEAK